MCHGESFREWWERWTTVTSSCGYDQYKKTKHILSVSPNTVEGWYVWPTVAYAGFSKGGVRKFRKFENNENQNENFSPQNQSVFLPKIRWRPKKKSSLKLSGFWPKIGKRPKKVFAYRLCTQTFCPSYKGVVGAMTHFCILFYANYTILATRSGGHGPMPPLNTPLLTNQLDIIHRAASKVFRWCVFPPLSHCFLLRPNFPSWKLLWNTKLFRALSLLPETFNLGALVSKSVISRLKKPSWCYCLSTEKTLISLGEPLTIICTPITFGLRQTYTIIFHTGD